MEHVVNDIVWHFDNDSVAIETLYSHQVRVVVHKAGVRTQRDFGTRAEAIEFGERALERKLDPADADYRLETWTGPKVSYRVTRANGRFRCEMLIRDEAGSWDDAVQRAERIARHID